jgi:hypothetical protein
MTRYPLVGSIDGATTMMELTFPPGQMVFNAKGSCRAIAYDLMPVMLTRLRDMGPRLLTLAGTRIQIHADAIVRAFDDAFGARSMILAQADEIERAGVRTVDPGVKEGPTLRVAHGQELAVSPGELQKLNPFDELKESVAKIPRFSVTEDGPRTKVRLNPKGEWMRADQVHQFLGL